MKVKLAVAFATLFFASLARADSQYTITFNVLQESSPAPTPSFGIGTIDTAFEQYGDGPYLDFAFIPNIGAATYGAVLEDFSPTTETVYFCDGCSEAGTSDVAETGAIFQSGTMELYAADGNTILSGSTTWSCCAFPQQNYWAWGTLTFSEPSPASAPEPPTWLLLILGAACMLAYTAKTTKQRRAQGN